MTVTLMRALMGCPLIAILRADCGDYIDRVVDEIVAAGVRALEITLPTPGSIRAISRAVTRHGNAVAIGAGTVLTETDVVRAEKAGAQFVVSPDTEKAVIGKAADLGLEAIPGAYTPTEILCALAAGATAVKLFPARSLGPNYVSDVLAPLPDSHLIPVGGIGHEDIDLYLRAGALAVGVGSTMMGTSLTDGDTQRLSERASLFVSAALKTRQSL